MEIHVGVGALIARLLLTAVLAGLLGLDRSEHGHAAGLRTTLLVALAACAAMLQANLLLGTVGKPSDSFIVLDLMRNPLGILTGVGFIGAGAIIRRGDRTQGVTTAATLWFVTVMGLCIGGGQMALGLLAFLMGALVIWPMRWIERRVPTIQRATLFLRFQPGAGHDVDARKRLLRESKIGVMTCSARYENHSRLPITCRLKVKGHFASSEVPPPIGQLAVDPAVTELRWST